MKEKIGDAVSWRGVNQSYSGVVVDVLPIGDIVVRKDDGRCIVLSRRQKKEKEDGIRKSDSRSGE